MSAVSSLAKNGEKEMQSFSENMKTLINFHIYY